MTMGDISKKGRMLGGLWGAVVGDALGVPVEFKGRDARVEDPVTDMRGYGTFNLPPGSWSDDSSLMLCTAEGLLEGFDADRIGGLFIRWFAEGYRTPHGVTFDVGRGTWQAITRMQSGTAAGMAGGDEESNNGNGSLMRILPVALYGASMPEEEMLRCAHDASSITHRHPRAMMACGMYCLAVRALMEGLSPHDAYRYSIGQARRYYGMPPFSEEMPLFGHLLAGDIDSLPEDSIASDGYVLHTLEAAVWCFLNTGSYREAVLKAVNLGWDTDTTAIVTGGLTGVHYGLDAVPQQWRDTIVRKEDVGALFEKFVETIKTA